MPEDVEEQPRKPFDLSKYVDLVRRRHMQFLIPLLLGWLLVWGLSWVLPPRYKSTTQILIEKPSVPKDYVVSNIGDDLEDRLQSIEQQIESRTRLLLIIDHLHLYESKHHPLTPDGKVARMIKDIDIQLLRNTGNGAISAFQVSYTAPSPALAQEVTTELTSLFINENQQTLERESEATTKFMEQRLEDARGNLAQQEARVRDFRTAHEGELPSQEASNLQILGGFQSQLQNEQDALNTARQQHIYLQTLIDQYRAMHVTAEGPDKPANVAAIDQQLATMRGQLTDLTTRYTDRHPAVQNLRSEITKTEELRKEMVAEAAGHPAATSATGAPRDIGSLGANAQLVQLQSQIEANQTEIKNREQEIAQQKDRIGLYQQRLNAEPASEEQLADLTRGYEQSQANYNDLLKKKNNSEMATSLEHMQAGERFSILDPPSLPLKPEFPNRLKFCGLGLGVGMALGFCLAGAFEFLDDRLHQDKQIVEMLQATVISEIPEILRPADQRRSRWHAVLSWSSAVLVLVVILAGSLLSYLRS
jgi:polysaccharide chain length determinant protein (PEP-CTERM system associated)